MFLAVHGLVSFLILDTSCHSKNDEFYIFYVSYFHFNCSYLVLGSLCAPPSVAFVSIFFFESLIFHSHSDCQRKNVISKLYDHMKKLIWCTRFNVVIAITLLHANQICMYMFRWWRGWADAKLDNFKHMHNPQWAQYARCTLYTLYTMTFYYNSTENVNQCRWETERIHWVFILETRNAECKRQKNSFLFFYRRFYCWKCWWKSNKNIKSIFKFSMSGCIGMH